MQPAIRTRITRRPRLHLVEPPRVRRTDPATSRQAAAVVKVSPLRLQLLQFLAEHDRARGWIGDELDEAGVGGACPWKRAGECVGFGWLQLARNRRGEIVTRPGRRSGPASQQAYRITEEGRRVIDAQR